MNSDFKELLKILLENKVRFLIIGGYAVIRYTEPRYTKDLDILIESNKVNAKRVLQSLKEFGAPLFALKSSDLTKAGTFFQMGVAPNRVDIIVTVPGVDFKKAFPRAEHVKIDEITVPIIGLEDLIQSKLAAGRPQDLVDAGALTKSKLLKRKVRKK